jgi:hypothetical protein
VQVLLLDGNDFRDLGEAVKAPGWLGRLTRLDLSNNRFAAVPAALAAASALRRLLMQGQEFAM